MTTVDVERLPAIPGGWAEREVAVGERAFRLRLPADPDAFLEEPEVHAAHEASGYMPYWAYLWPAAVETAEVVAGWTGERGGRALEIGAGVGLAGLAALTRGFEVTFSDHDRLAVQLAVHNARWNGFAQAKGLCFDWREPPEETFPLILASDVLYEARNHEPLLNVVKRMLADGGECRIGDCGREQAGAFVDAARRRGYVVKVVGKSGDELRGAVRGRFQVVVLRKG